MPNSPVHSHEDFRTQELAYTCVPNESRTRSEGAQGNRFLKPFLTPVSASSNELVHKVLLPLGVIIGVVRVLVVAAVGLLYFLLDSALSLLLVSLSSHTLRVTGLTLH